MNFILIPENLTAPKCQLIKANAKTKFLCDYENHGDISAEKRNKSISEYIKSRSYFTFQMIFSDTLHRHAFTKKKILRYNKNPHMSKTLRKAMTFISKIKNPYKSSRRRCSLKKCVLRNFAKFIGKHLYQGLFFNKVAGLRPANLLKKKLWHKCFPVNFEKFLGAPLLQNTSGRLFLPQHYNKART